MMVNLIKLYLLILILEKKSGKKPVKLREICIIAENFFEYEKYKYVFYFINISIISIQ